MNLPIRTDTALEKRAHEAAKGVIRAMNPGKHEFDAMFALRFDWQVHAQLIQEAIIAVANGHAGALVADAMKEMAEAHANG